MPVHTGSLSRRDFLTQGTLAVGGLAVVSTLGWAYGEDAATNPNLLALLSDTHIPNAPEVIARDTNMTSNLRQVVREVTALKTRPAGVVINGDCAYLKGLSEDYANLAKCLVPLQEAGLPLHLTMGNHDHRGHLFAELQAQRPKQPVLESKHVTILETPHANWFLLDSLTETDVVTGEIGAEQRDWLAKAIAARPDKPALVMAHHTPQFEPPAEGQAWGGIKDTAEFLELLTSFKQVKAFLFGHSHNWSVTKRDKLQLINLPPVAYVFAAGKPNGWVLAETRADGLSLELRTIDPAHKQSGEKFDLVWG